MKKALLLSILALSATNSLLLCNDAAAAENLAADSSRPNNSTFVLGEAVSLTFTATGLTPSSTQTLTLTVSDEVSTQLRSAAIPIHADSTGSASVSFTPPAGKFGYYKVDAKLSDGTSLAGIGTRPAGFITYAVVPDPAKRANYGDAGSHFGMQGGFSAAQGSVIPYLGIRFILTGPGWANLEPDHAGQFAAAVSAASKKGQVFPIKSSVTTAVMYNNVPWATYAVPLVTSAKIPAWAIDASTAGRICKQMGALKPDATEAYSAFAESLAAEVSVNYPAQSARYYQITWEPADWCFNGTPQQLVQFYQLAYGRIHRSDPKAIITGPTLYPNTPLDYLWAAGLGNYLDAVSMHPYAKFPPENDNFISNIRMQMQAAKDAKGHSIPFIGTEQGYASGKIGELNEALGNIRTTLILLGEGFKFNFAFYVHDFWDYSPVETGHTYGYYWNLNPKIDYGTDKISPKPAVPAFAAMTFLFDGTTTEGPMTTLTGTQMGYRFTRDGITTLALWDYQANASSVTLNVPDQALQVCDWMGNCASQATNASTITLKLGSAPIYLIGKHL